MAIKDVYNQVTKDKENKVKDSDVSIPLKEFISEHKNLVKILRSGDKKAQEAEAAKQEAELKEETGETAEDDESTEDMAEDKTDPADKGGKEMD